MARISVRRLTLTDFRSYGSLRLEVDDRPVALSGPNGAGKTNLLEALSFLVPGRGLRRARLAEIGRRGADDEGPGAAWAVAATVAIGDGTCEIGTGIAGRPSGGDGDGNAVAPGRRTVRIDGTEVSRQAELGERVCAVWLTPEMGRLFDDGRSPRRRFLDRLVFGLDPAHAARLGDYERAARERMRLLRGRDGRADSSWLAALEDGMARSGVAVAAARRAVVDRLSAACALGVGPFPAADLAVEGDVEGWLAEVPALEVEDRFRDRLAANRRRDAETGHTTTGVQRSDLACRHIAKGVSARRCSTGEQKALLISIVLANARLQALERGVAPLLLLDEVAAHLDGERRDALFDEIYDLGVQAWMTAADAALLAPLGERAQHFAIADATIARAA